MVQNTEQINTAYNNLSGISGFIQNMVSWAGIHPYLTIAAVGAANMLAIFILEREYR